jgi:hypothetical protein
MAAVEHYDITGKYPEKDELEKELQDVERRIAEAEDTLRSEKGMGAPEGVSVSQTNYHDRVARAKRDLEDLKTRREEIKNDLFKFDPAQER